MYDSQARLRHIHPLVFKTIVTFHVGILEEDIIVQMVNSIMLENITEDEKLKWKRKYSVSITQYLEDSMVKYVGKSLNDFLR